MCAHQPSDLHQLVGTLNSDVPLTHHQTGSYCGVKSAGWTLANGRKSLTRSTRPADSGPSMGDMTLRPIATTGGAGIGSVSFGTSDDPAALYQTFAATGRFPDDGVQPGDRAHGAAAISAEIPPSSNATLTVLFSWHFPDRDFSGEILGNRYVTFALVLLSLPFGNCVL